MESKNAPSVAYAASRRRFLRDATFVSLGVVAASCVPAPTAPGGGGAKGKRGGEFHAAWPYDLPPKGVWNVFAPTPILGGSYLIEIPYQDLAIYRWADKKWDYLLAESHSVTTDTIEVKLRKGVKWDDGSDVTSKDAAATFQIGRITGAGIWNFAADLETPDAQTIRFKMKQGSALAERYVLRTGVRPASVYGTIADKVKALFASGKDAKSDEATALKKELQALVVDKPSSNGPYKIDPASLTEAQVTMVKNPGGLFADKVNFDKIVIFNGETEQVTPLVLAGDVDYATHFFPQATEKAFVDKGLKIVRGPLYTGPALYFQWLNAPEFQDPKLRQAITFALDRDQANQVAYGATSRAPKWNAGANDSLLETWLSADDQKRLTAYTHDASKAESLLKEAGYTRGADGWAKDGKKLDLEIQYPSDFTDWAAVATNIGDQLKAFGFGVTLRGVPWSTEAPDFNNGKFTVSFHPWGIAHPHPQVSMVRPLREFNTTPPGGGQKYPLKQKTSKGEVDFEALLDQAVVMDEAKQKEAVTKLAFAFNELLPAIPLAERFNNAPINDQARVSGWPPLDDKIYQNGGGDNFTLILLMDGTLGSK